MAYIYEYAFLCTNLVDANRIQYYLGDYTEPGMGGVMGKIGDLNCWIGVGSHDYHNATLDGESLWWVSVIPQGDEGGTRWPSGGPKNQKDANEMLKFAESFIYRHWPDRLKFEYASPGVEVTGFRNYDEIVELLQIPDIDLHGVVISYELWAEANRPLGWTKLSSSFDSRFLYIPYRGEKAPTNIKPYKYEKTI